MKNKTFGMKKYIILAVFLVACVLSVIFMKKITINYNISDYLADNTETKISMDINNAEFGATGNIQVMIKDIDVQTAKNVKEKIAAIENILIVNFDEYSENYYKDGDALFVILVDGDEYSDVAAEVLSNIKTELADFSENTEFGGTVAEKAKLRKAIEGEIPLILAISLCMVVIVMLIMAKSWLEPFVLLAASGVAVLINMGTNALFGEISYITNAVAAILQLALSVDYSIVLLHSYRTLKTTEESSEAAMIKAIKEVVKPVSASALTTIAGLLALLFMSFKIGFDIGTVLMKGIVISAVVSLTLLPVFLLYCDKLMEKTRKRDLVLRGRAFCKMSFSASKVIVPCVLVLIILCGVLQPGISYTFTDSKNTNTTISGAFGDNSSFVVLYPVDENNYELENLLATKLGEYKTLDGKTVLKSHTAYSNTAREPYDIALASKKLNLASSDVSLLFAMYQLDKDNSLVTFNALDFVEYSDKLLSTDEEAAAIVDEKTAGTLRLMLVINELMNSANTAEEFCSLLASSGIEGMALDLFSIQQMYGLYFYDTVENKEIDFEQMLAFMIEASKNENLEGMFDEATVSSLNELLDGIRTLIQQMDSYVNADEFSTYISELFGGVLTIDAEMLYSNYFESTGKAPTETIRFLDILKYFGQSMPFAGFSDKINSYELAYNMALESYEFDEFMPALIEITAALTGTAPEINTSADSIQQLYIMYFLENGTLVTDKILGREFVKFVREAAETNTVISAKLPEESRAKLDDALTLDAFLCVTEEYDYVRMTEQLNALIGNIKSMPISATLDKDKISGIYIKRAVELGRGLDKTIEAIDLLEFVLENMNTNALLASKISEENKAKVEGAKADVERAGALFNSDNYSRMLLSVDLPREGEESFRFVQFLTQEVKSVFGEEAHVAGELVANYDLYAAFEYDNTVITIFTIVAILLIIAVIFRSVSLPVLLVAIIQGAIWMAMATSYITGPIFFMSYIVATCILMGATIDYGILMSTNYVNFRENYDRKEALYRAVEATMPTVFTSGLILIICGFIVSLISSQISISAVGELLGKGTFISVLMITLVLPSVLYLCDKFILKFTMKKKK